DALAYLRLTLNRDDDTAFERVVNTPLRGLGDRTIEALRAHAQTHQCSLWQAATRLLAESYFAARAAASLEHFIQLIETLSSDSRELTLHEQTEHVIQNSGLIEHYRKEKGEKGLARLENLEELISAAREFHGEDTGLNTSPLAAFLASSALEAGEGQADHFADSVQLMTLHSAKGLEFPVVFLCGCEEGLFPHYMTMEDPKGLEEERRLCYVGMTRAMQQLFMTYAETRRLHGKEVYHRPSRFLSEIPEEFLESVRLKAKISLPAAHRVSESTGYLLSGQEVTHKQFGRGVVLQCEGRGEHARVQVKFEKTGTKWLIASFVTA
ncbi:MAG TPA: 3'-5' exonuclease, partial [Gammaproteobacteria bacterium]|nr:3'-5' exonuclease [Gammaproteobacteria bacterium]